MSENKFSCPCCGNNCFTNVVSFSNCPVSGMHRSSLIAHLPLQALTFDTCKSCGLLRNHDFDKPPSYLEKPRETSRQLPIYLDYLLNQIVNMTDKNDLIIEIGSNDGSFLDVLKNEGYVNICGVEPSKELAKIAEGKGHRIIEDYFELSLVETLRVTYGNPKMVICRHTLEHVPFPRQFIQALNQLLEPENGTALVEVPDSTAIPEGLNFVELWDEHLFYFTPYTLRLLMECNGLRVTSEMTFPHLDTRNILVGVEYGMGLSGQVEACNDSGEVGLWKSFSEQFQIVSEQIRNVVKTQQGPIYLVGASHPQCNFVNYLGLESFVDFMIDDDPVKVGKLPSIKSDSVRVISSEEFSDQPPGGTVLSTGFGYAQWTRRINDIAISKGMKVIDPLSYA